MTSNTDIDVAVQEAAATLRRGGIVAFPTETVYGLGADAENPVAVARLFMAKGRPADHPVIVHIGDAEQLERWAVDIPPSAALLAQRFWPGPLTLILKRDARVPDAVTGGQDTVGLRVPDHPVALALLAAFGGGIAAPSANRFGRLSPTTAAHVRTDLGEAVDYVLDGGSCQVGIESTILDLSGARPRLLRPGVITAAELEAVLGEKLAGPSGNAPRSPGALPSHYAPRTPLVLVPPEDLAAEVVRRLEKGERVAVLARSVATPQIEWLFLSGSDFTECAWQVMPADPGGYAHELYARLHALDALHADCLLIEAPPVEAAWQAVRDRLARAARARLD
ncbi:MAG TPA: L-threonylcarbamoyladenylate synthase [Gammaproteobacteria bacterium]